MDPLVEQAPVQNCNPSRALGAAGADDNRPASRKFRALALLCAFLFPTSIAGQMPPTASIHGRVVGDDSTPIIRALVELVGRAERLRTSTSGEFVFHRVSVGSAVLRVQAFTFADSEVRIQVARDSGWRGTIVLTPVPLRLEEVVVTAMPEDPRGKYLDFFRRRRVGFGTFRTRADIDRMAASDLVGLLRQIPGVSVSATFNPYGQPETRFRMARCPGQPPNLAIYINGQRVAVFGRDSENKGSELSGLFRQRPPKSTCDDCTRLSEVLASVPVSEIMFLEFYRGPGQIPADLDRGDSCAALVIWTR
jgi:hypothetical protein